MNDGAGRYPAGMGPAGHAPVRGLSPRTDVAPVVAPFFDPATRDYPLSPGGQLQSVHPVDQAVALALSVEHGAIASDPGFGHKLRKLPRGDRASVKNAAADVVAQALKTLTDRGDVTVLGVEVELPRRGVVVVDVRYRNNRLSPARAMNARVTI